MQGVFPKVAWTQDAPVQPQESVSESESPGRAIPGPGLVLCGPSAETVRLYLKRLPLLGVSLAATIIH